MQLLSPAQEKTLLLQISRGDTDAFSSLFYAYNDKLYSFIFRITGSEDLSEDILQDVFLKIWNKREQLSDVNNFSAFLFTVARHHAFNQLKRMARETLIKKQKSKTAINSHTPDEQLQYSNLEKTLAQILNTLPPQQQTIYKLSREQQMNQKEIAQQMNLSVSTVQNHLYRALKTIREKLEKHYPVSGLLILWVVHLIPSIKI